MQRLPVTPYESDSSSAESARYLFFAVDSTDTLNAKNQIQPISEWHGIQKSIDILYDENEIRIQEIKETERYRTSIFETKTGVAFPKPEPHAPQQNAWLSLFFAGTVLVAGSIRYYNNRSFQLLQKSTFGNYSVEELLREKKHITGVSFTAPFLLSSFIYAVALAFVVRENSGSFLFPGMEVIVLFLGFILLQILKHALLKLFCELFEMNTAAEQHIVYHHQFYCFSGWFFLPMLGIALFLPVNNVVFFHILFYASILLSALYTCIRMIVNYSYKRLNYIGLFILYICSTEVLPVMTILKLIDLKR